jgi:hypothetical protein
MRSVIACVALLWSAGAMAQADGAQLKNWFDDPFFKLSDALPGCPVPRGPLMTAAEMKSESHSRIERGTSCYMAGSCKQPNAYLYDAGIAQDIQRALAGHAALRNTSLWITVKRRFVWLEGCAADMDQVRMLAAALRGRADVEMVLVNVMQGTTGKTPYPILPGIRR